MTSGLVPITRDRHGQKTFRRFSSYGFAGTQTVAPLVAAELAKVAVSFPIAFLRENNQTVLVAVLGIEPGINLFVAPDGRWAGPYVPAAFRSYPFVLAETEDNRQVLCVNEASGLVVDDPSGEAFFAEGNTPSEAVRGILDFLMKIHENRLLTVRACEALARHDLLEPWTLIAPGESGPRQVTGLWRISEDRLGQLGDEAFLELRRTGALALAYAQLMSMGHLPLLERLASLRAEMAKRSAAPLPASLDSVFGTPGASEELTIDWSKFKS